MIAGLAVLGVLYVGVVLLYALHQGTEVSLADGGAAADAMTLQVEPRKVDAAGRGIDLLLTPDAGTGPLASGDELTLDEPMTLVVTPSNGERQFDYPQGRIVGAVEVTIPFDDGAVEQWPFDSYHVQALVIPNRLDGNDALALDVAYTASGNVPGWVIDVTVDRGDGSDPPTVDIRAHRPIATVAFAIVLLSVMVVMPILVLIVAIWSYRGARRVEATLMGWIAAMLFATIPLRSFLPDAPPIGSWVDYLVVLWVIVGLVLGLGIFTAAWLRWTGEHETPPRW